MNKKREYAHEDMEALRKEIEVLQIRARQVNQDIRSGAISHEQWVSAAQELMERKKEILEILVVVDRYKQDLRAEIDDIDFGEYVEDILTRMMNGDDDYRSMIPCYYTPGKKQEKKVA